MGKNINVNAATMCALDVSTTTRAQTHTHTHASSIWYLLSRSQPTASPAPKRKCLVPAPVGRANAGAILENTQSTTSIVIESDAFNSMLFSITLTHCLMNR